MPYVLKAKFKKEISQKAKKQFYNNLSFTYLEVLILES